MNEWPHLTVGEVIAPDMIEKLLADSPRLEHLRSCPECREILGDYAEYLEHRRTGFPVLSEADRNRLRHAICELAGRAGAGISDFHWRRIRDLLAWSPDVLAAADGQNADQQLQESSQRSGYLFFKAQCPANHPRYWCARIAIPTRPTADTVLRIHLQDGRGNAIPSGIFHLCGLTLPVKNGKAFLKLTEFQRHLDTPVASFAYAGEMPQDGAPALFEPEEE